MSTDDTNNAVKRSDNKNADAVHGQLSSLEELVSEGEEDVHACAKCKLLFRSLELYVEHKLTSKSCGKQFDRKNLLKRLGTRRGRPPGSKNTSKDDSKNKIQQTSTKSNQLVSKERESDIIPHTVNYQCDKCHRGFRREAALNRHKEYDHQEKDSDDSGSSGGEEEISVSNNPSVTEENLEDSSPGRNTIQYIETLIYDPETGLYTKSSTPTIIENTIENVLEAKNQIPVVPENPIKIENTYALPNLKGNFVKGKRSYIKQPKLTPEEKSQSYGSHQCKKCGKFFATTISLNWHQITHNPDRPFKCTYHGCTYSFKTNGSLKRHIRRHTGERPYQCKLCGRTFRESGALNRHKKGRQACINKPDSDFPRYKKNLELPRVEESDEVEERVEGDGINDAELRIKREAEDTSEKPQKQNRLVRVGPSTKPRYKIINVDDGQLPSGIDPTCVVFTQGSSSEHLIQEVNATVSEEVESVLQGIESGSDQVAVDQVDSVVMHEDVDSYVEMTLDSADVTEDDDYDDDSSRDLMKTLVSDETSISEDTFILDGEEGEIRSDSETIPTPHVMNAKSSIPEDTDPLTCSVDGLSFPSAETLIDHLKSHLFNVNFHCDRCNYFCEMQTQMQEHMTLAHHEQWTHENMILHEPADEEIISTGEIYYDNISAISINEVTESMDSLASDRAMTEEIITHVDEVAMATNVLTGHENIHIIQPQEDYIPNSAVIVQSEQDYPASKRTSKDKKIEKAVQSTAKVALDQLFALYQPKGIQHDYCINKNSQCFACGKKFKSQTYLKIHLRTHTGEKAFKCQVCQKGFSSRDALVKHSAAHSEDRNYKCGECGKFFKRISHVREHLRVHSSDRPYSCKYCLKSFKSVNTCKVHQRIHADKFQFKCRICNKGFRERASVSRHMRTHTGERPYPCPRCGRRFAEHGTLNRHLKSKVPCTKDTTNAQQQIGNRMLLPKGPLSIIKIESNSEPVQSILTEPLLKAEPTQVKFTILEDGKVQQEVISEPNLLSEFSSVADSQEYLADEAQEESSEYVMISQEEHDLLMQNSGDIEGVNDEQVEYIVMDQEGSMDTIILVDQKTGQQLQLVSSNTVHQENLLMPDCDIVDSEESRMRIVTMEIDSAGTILTENVEYLDDEIAST